MADAETNVVVQLEARVDEAIAAFQQFQQQVSQQFSQVEDQVNTTFDGAKAKVTETADHFEREGKRMGEGIVNGVGLLAAALGAGFVISLRNSMRQVSEMADQLHELSVITGAPMGKLQQFQFALTQIGLPAQNLQFMLVQLQARIEQAGVAATSGRGPLHELGMTVKEFANLDAIDKIKLLADRIKSLSPGAGLDVTRQLMGFRAGALYPLLAEGSEGITRLMNAFKPIPDDVLDSFRRLTAETAALRQTWTAFSAELLKPIIDMLQHLVATAVDFVNKLRDLPESTKMPLLIASVAAGTLAFERLAEMVGTFLAQGLGFRTLIDILERIAVPLRILSALVIAAALSWQSNFGNIRGVVLEVFEAIEEHITQFRSLWNEAVSDFEAVVIPAFQRLGQAITNLLTPMADSTAEALGNKGAWAQLKDAIDSVVGILAKLVDGLTWTVQHLQQVGTFILSVLVASALPSLIAIVGKAQVAFEALAISEDAAFPPLIALQALIVLVSALILAQQAHVDLLRVAWDKFKDIFPGLIDGFANLVGAIEAVTGTGLIEWLAKVAFGAKTDSDNIHELAQKYRDLRNAEDEAREAKEKQNAADSSGANDLLMGPNARLRGGGILTKPTKPTTSSATPASGTGALIPDVDKNAAAKAFQEWLNSVKDAMLPAQLAVARLEGAFKILEARIKALGTIDSPRKLAQAIGLIGQEAALANKELAPQAELVRRNADAIAELQKKRATTTDHKEQVEIDRMILELTNQRNTETVKYIELQAQARNQAQQQYDIEQKYVDTISRDTLNSWNERINAQRQAYEFAVKHGAALDLQHKALKDLLDLEQQRAAAIAKQITGQADITEAQAKLATAQAGPAASGGAGHNLRLADLWATYEADMARVHAAQLQYQNDLAATHNYTATQLRDTEEGQKAQDALNTSTKAVIQAETTAADAWWKWTSELNVTATEINKEWDSLAKQVGGPLYFAINGLISQLHNWQGYQANYIQALIDLISKSLLYKDVEVFVMEVTQTFGRLLDAIRPVLDFFLGVMIGVVNVFISLYDVLATILDVFGAMITKIKLLNSDLQNMNAQAQPLIQIVHDLPTLAEYNKGYWTQLIGQQDAANNNLNILNADILQGFDKTASKIGEVIGILLAIKVILGLVMGQSVGQTLGGLWQNMQSFFGRIFGGGAAGGGASIMPGIGALGGTSQASQLFTQAVQQFTAGTQIQNLASKTFELYTNVGQQATTVFSTSTDLDKAISTIDQATGTTNQGAAGIQQTAAGVQQTAGGTMTAAVTLFQAAVIEFEAAITSFEAGSFLGGLLHAAAGAATGGGVSPVAINVGGAGGGFAPSAGGAPGSFSSAQSLQVNFNGDNIGLDSEYVYNRLKPVFDRLMTEYQQQTVLFSRSNQFAFSRGLSIPPGGG